MIDDFAGFFGGMMDNLRQFKKAWQKAGNGPPTSPEAFLSIYEQVHGRSIPASIREGLALALPSRWDDADRDEPTAPAYSPPPIDLDPYGAMTIDEVPPATPSPRRAEMFPAEYTETGGGFPTIGDLLFDDVEDEDEDEIRTSRRVRGDPYTYGVAGGGGA